MTQNNQNEIMSVIHADSCCDGRATRNKNIQLAGVDLIKYLMAFAIVAIHVRPHYNFDWQYPELIWWFIKLGVPFYFIASGYLIQKKLLSLPDFKLRKQYLTKRIKKLFKLWACWLIIYTPLALYTYGLFPSKGFNLQNIILSSKAYIWGLAVDGCSPWAEILWFVYSMIWVTLIIRMLLDIKYYKLYLLCCFVLLTLTYWMANNLDIFLFRLINQYTYHILGGGIYIISGMLLVGREKYIKPYIFVTIIIFSLLLYHFKLPLSAPVGGIGIFMLSMWLPLKSSSSLASLRPQSMWIYFTHPYFIYLYFIILSIKNTGLNIYIVLLIVSATVALFAKFLSILQQKNQFKFLNFLVS